MSALLIADNERDGGGKVLARDMYRGLYRTLRALSLLGGLLVCLVMLAQHAAIFRQPDLWLLCAFALPFSIQAVVVRRGSDGLPITYHLPGCALIVVALLRDGPATALAVSLFSMLLAAPLTWRTYRAIGEKFDGDPFLFSALSGLCGALYLRFGGHLLLTPSDAARFFQAPTFSALPFLAAQVIVFEVIGRAFLGTMAYLRHGQPMRETVLNPMFTFFYYAESLGGALILVLWTTYGWTTLPFTLLVNQALLLSARSYYARMEARRDVDCDLLTGLASWRGLDNWLRRRIGNRHNRRRVTPFALLFLDVDNLKQVNDRFGHAMGDQLLQLVGESCRLHARTRDFVGRRSGDEFLIVLDGLDCAGAEKVRYRLQQAVEDAVAVHPQFSQAGVGVSIGLAAYPDDAQDEAGLIEAADQRMYADKRARKASRVAGFADPPEIHLPPAQEVRFRTAH